MSETNDEMDEDAIRLSIERLKQHRVYLATARAKAPKRGVKVPKADVNLNDLLSGIKGLSGGS